MQVTEVKVTPVDQSPLKGYVSIVIDHCLSIRDIRVISGPDGYFVSMPSKKQRNGRFVDTVAPLNKETRKLIEDAVLGAFEREIGERVTRRQQPGN